MQEKLAESGCQCGFCDMNWESDVVSFAVLHSYVLGFRFNVHWLGGAYRLDLADRVTCRGMIRELGPLQK